MNILFLHRNFPGQFKNLINELLKDKSNNIVFITDDSRFEIKGVRKMLYNQPLIPSENCHPYLVNYTNAVLHGKASANIALQLKKQGFKPDIIFGFSGWGNSLFMKDVYPDVPLLSYYEWYYNSDSADIPYLAVAVTDDMKASIRCKNSKFLIDLYSADAGFCPTQWQKSQFPKDFQDKIKVIHDGIDTEVCKPNPDAIFSVDGYDFSVKDEVITYVARGFEPYRGFIQFMEAVEKLLKKRPKAHVVIAGDDVVCYGSKLEHGTYKELMLQRLKLDMKRVHFTGALDYDDYISLLQVSSVHIYLTLPYVLSWSVLEAMSVGCCLVVSGTEPVQEFMTNNENALFVDITSVEHIVKRTIHALENKSQMKKIRENARKTIIEKCSLDAVIPQQLEYINSLVGKKK